jgi:hypothetical protein
VLKLLQQLIDFLGMPHHANTAAPVVQVTRYAYDAFGRRVSKTDRFGTTHFHWDGNRLLGEQRGNRRVLYLYEPGSFAPLAQLETATVTVTVTTTEANTLEQGTTITALPPKV